MLFRSIRRRRTPDPELLYFVAELHSTSGGSKSELPSPTLALRPAAHTMANALSRGISKRLNTTGTYNTATPAPSPRTEAPTDPAPATGARPSAVLLRRVGELGRIAKTFQTFFERTRVLLGWRDHELTLRSRWRLQVSPKTIGPKQGHSPPLRRLRSFLNLCWKPIYFFRVMANGDGRACSPTSSTGRRGGATSTASSPL